MDILKMLIYYIIIYCYHRWSQMLVIQMKIALILYMYYNN